MVTTSPPASVSNTTILVCENLPPTPVLGWKDSTIDENKNINAFFFNSVNADEIVYVTNGDVFGYNKIFTYNIPKQKNTYLGSSGTYIPQVNNKGWIVFCSGDFNIFKIKTNGDSLRQLTWGNMFHSPQWDYTGKYIYFFQAAFNIQPAQFVKTDANGTPVNYLTAEIPNMALGKKKNVIAYLKQENNNVAIYYKDLNANYESSLVSSPAVSSLPQLTFNNLTFDNNDENLYWNTDKGIFSYNMTTKKVTQLFANCQTLIYDRPVISPNSNELNYSCHIIQPLDYGILFHSYKAFQMNVNTNVSREIRIFP